MNTFRLSINSVVQKFIVVLAFIPREADAHGIEFYYFLPIPLINYLLAASTAIALTFVVSSLFVRGYSPDHQYWRVNILKWRFGKLITHLFVIFLLRLLSVTLFVLVISAGLIGDQHPISNIAPIFVWVIWWVGMAYVCALIGNLWSVVNPWKIIFEWAELIYMRCASGERLSRQLKYPKYWGVWPGVFLFFCFAWIENVYSNSVVPKEIALLTLGYSLITWAGMFFFGKEVWLRRGEAFSIAFTLFAKFAPLEIRIANPEICSHCTVECRGQDGVCVDCSECFNRASFVDRQLNLRPYAIGLLRKEDSSFSMMAFVLLILATVTFDGFISTPAWMNIQNIFLQFVSEISTVASLGFVAFYIVFICIYLFFSLLIAVFGGGNYSVISIAVTFVYSIVPIALAYHFAHYLYLLLIQGQLIIPLLSDPFGYGWNLFGTASYRVNVKFVGAEFYWLTALITIVLGHVIAVYIGHISALRIYRSQKISVRSQYPMLVLMISYTVTSIWILAQPIISRG